MASTSVQTCYYPDGSVAAGNRPYNTSCTSVRGVVYHRLLPHETRSASTPMPTTTRLEGSCTDSTWQSKDCPQFCQTPSLSGGGSLLGSSYSGNGNIYCCGVGPNAEAYSQRWLFIRGAGPSSETERRPSWTRGSIFSPMDTSMFSNLRYSLLSISPPSVRYRFQFLNPN